MIWELDDPTVYKDDYLSTVWSAQGKREIAASLKEIYGAELPLYYKFVLNKPALQDRPHCEVIKAHGDQSLFKLTYFVFVSTAFDRRREAERAFRILQTYVLNNNLRLYYFAVYYLETAYRNEFTHQYMADPERLHQVLDFRRLRQEQKLVNLLHISDMSRVAHDVDTAMKYFEY